MKLKSYFAESVEAAMTQAGQELGSDAMLVYSRQSPIEARHLGAYEVVFGMSSDSELDAVTPASAPAPTVPTAREPFEPPLGTGVFGTLQRELGNLRSQVKIQSLAAPGVLVATVPGSGSKAVHVLVDTRANKSFGGGRTAWPRTARKAIHGPITETVTTSLMHVTHISSASSAASLRRQMLAAV